MTPSIPPEMVRPSRVSRFASIARAHAFASSTYDNRVSTGGRGSLPRPFAFPPVFSRVSVLLPAPPLCVGFREISRGPSVTVTVTLGPQTSLRTTLALSHQRVQTG